MRRFGKIISLDSPPGQQSRRLQRRKIRRQKSPLVMVQYTRKSCRQATAGSEFAGALFVDSGDDSDLLGFLNVVLLIDGHRTSPKRACVGLGSKISKSSFRFPIMARYNPSILGLSFCLWTPNASFYVF
jgi:hypothetical protein